MDKWFHPLLDEIISPFPNFSSVVVEVWEMISNFISHFTGQVITYGVMLVKGVPSNEQDLGCGSGKTLLKPMLAYQLDTQEQTLVMIQSV